VCVETNIVRVMRLFTSKTSELFEVALILYDNRYSSICTFVDVNINVFVLFVTC